MSDALITEATVKACTDPDCLLVSNQIAQVDGLTTVKTSNAVDVTLWGLSGSVSRRMTKNSSVSLEVRYRLQDASGTVALTEDIQHFWVGLRFSYSIDPIRF